jgi:hypothetical protein
VSRWSPTVRPEAPPNHFLRALEGGFDAGNRLYSSFAQGKAEGYAREEKAHERELNERRYQDQVGRQERAEAQQRDQIAATTRQRRLDNMTRGIYEPEDVEGTPGRAADPGGFADRIDPGFSSTRKAPMEDAGFAPPPRFAMGPDGQPRRGGPPAGYQVEGARAGTGGRLAELIDDYDPITGEKRSVQRFQPGAAGSYVDVTRFDPEYDDRQTVGRGRADSNERIAAAVEAGITEPEARALERSGALKRVLEEKLTLPFDIDRAKALQRARGTGAPPRDTSTKDYFGATQQQIDDTRTRLGQLEGQEDAFGQPIDNPDAAPVRARLDSLTTRSDSLAREIGGVPQPTPPPDAGAQAREFSSYQARLYPLRQQAIEMLKGQGMPEAEAIAEANRMYLQSVEKKRLELYGR